MIYAYAGLTGLHPELGLLVTGQPLDDSGIRQEVLDSLHAGGMLKTPDAPQVAKAPAPTAASEK